LRALIFILPLLDTGELAARRNGQQLLKSTLPRRVSGIEANRVIQLCIGLPRNDHPPQTHLLTGSHTSPHAMSQSCRRPERMV